MVKEKTNGSRLYDKDGYRKRAGCVCVRSDDEMEILLVTASNHPQHWIVPGGGVEAGEEPDIAAVRETFEEAGVKGYLGRCLGVFENEDKKHRTTVYVMVVTEELVEWDESASLGRRRKWFSFEEASKKIVQHKPDQLRYLNALQVSQVE